MATSAKRSPFVTPRSSRAYRLEMEGRTIFFLLSLLILTGLVIFSLGVVTGMGMRDPADAIPIATAPPTKTEPPPNGESLSFTEGVKSPQPVIEGIKIDQGKISGQTKALLDRGEKVLTLEEAPRKGLPLAKQPLLPPTTKPAESPAAATAIRKETPAATPPSPAEAYTVQVFSSKHRDSARELIARLKKLGFSAYLNQYQAGESGTWYRVRVGKTSRAEAEELVGRLKKEAQLKSPHIVRL